MWTAFDELGGSTTHMNKNATPEAISRAFSNDHFIDIVRRWRVEVARAGSAGAALNLPRGMRREIAKSALFYPQQDRTTFAEAVMRMARSNNHPVQKKTIVDSFDKEKETLAPKWTSDLMTLLHEEFFKTQLPEQRPDFVPIYAREFNHDPFLGPNAPFIFCRRLLGLPKMEHWLRADHGDRGLFEYSSDARDQIVKALSAFLKPAPLSKPCFVVHSRVYQRGLNALAGRLLHGGLERPGFEDLPRCLLYASASAPPHKGVDLPFMLEQILAFYDGYVVKEASRSPDIDVRRNIERVRAYMTRYPAVFIVDGVRDFGPDQHDLRSVMLDDPFRLLIEHLLYPDLWSASDPPSAETFLRNRFVILADGPCDWLSPFREAAYPLPAPNTAAAKAFIQDDGAYRFGSTLKQYFENNPVTQISEEPLLQCADGLLSLSVGRDSLPAPHEIVEALVSRIVAERPSWVLPLLLLALTPGGLRAQTLFRLLQGFAQYKKENPFAHEKFCLTAALSEQDLELLCDHFSALILRADDHTLQDAVASDAAQLRGGTGSADTTLSFVSPATAELILQHLLGVATAAELSQIQVLLADESLRQHIKVMRTADRDDHSSIRTNRRLLQALFHGFMALDFSPTAELQSVAETGGITTRVRFNRIYAMFYRRLLEAPPHWEMSKVMSAEGVKRDILLTALAAERPLLERCAGKAIVSPTVAPRWLLREVGISRTTAAIANDLFAALCQATLQLNLFDEFDHVLAAARQIYAATHRDFRTVEQDDALDKLEADANILHDRLAPALGNVLKRLRLIGIRVSILPKARIPLEGCPENRSFPLRSEIEHIDPAVARRAISFVQRWAEILATNADDLLEGNGTHDIDRGTRRMFDAYVLFTLADELRWLAFANDPFSRADIPSGHSTRVQIRVLILLSRQPRYAAAAAGLLDVARHRADSLSRTFARYPAERASMMILESILTRLPDNNEGDLRAALDLIITADRQMIWATDRPRLRMRLLFERAKLLRRLAETRGPNAVSFGQWATLEAERLRLLAEHGDSALWIKLASRLDTPQPDIATTAIAGRRPRAGRASLGS